MQSNDRTSRRSVSIPAIYLIVTAACIALPVIVHAGEAGIWAGLLTLPWSAVGQFVADTVDPKLLDAPALGIAICGLGALINAYIMHRLIRRSEARRVMQETGPESTTETT